MNADASKVKVGPGIVGGEVNRRLAPFGKKIGPDPASIGAAKIGGIAANNASGMCCGTAQNSYRTLAGMRVMLADGSVLDTEDHLSVDAFSKSHAVLLGELERLGRDTRANAKLAERIRHKFKIKNTTGYSLNALIDYEDPIDILTPPDDRLGRHARLHFAHHLQHRRRRPVQGLGAGFLPGHPHRLRGGHPPQAAAGLGRRTARPPGPAFGREQARPAGHHARTGRGSRCAAHRSARCHGRRDK